MSEITQQHQVVIVKMFAHAIRSQKDLLVILFEKRQECQKRLLLIDESDEAKQDLESIKIKEDRIKAKILKMIDAAAWLRDKWKVEDLSEEIENMFMEAFA